MVAVDHPRPEQSVSSLVLIALAGFAAQLIDGSLGMAYGATSASLLLALGLAPTTASASIHLAEIGTTLAAGAAHWRLGNVDWQLALALGIPGAAGAFVGATALSRLSTAWATPVTSSVLLVIGAVLLLRFGRGRRLRRPGRVPTRVVVPLGLVAGFVDATGGGGWGPVATPSLLMSGRVEARKAIGTADTAEFLVALAASAGFLLALGREGFATGIVLALLAGGVVAAPLAAWLVRLVPERMLGASVGGLLLLTNANTLMGALDVPAIARQTIQVAIGSAWLLALAHAWARTPAVPAVVAADEPNHVVLESGDG